MLRNLIRSAGLTVLLASCALLIASCRRPDEPPPSIVLITIDTLRADHLSIYGYTERQTSNIDGLALEGVLFETAYCDVTWTTPSMASTLAGVYALRHGLRSNFDKFPERMTTFPEILKQSGYTTAAVIGSYPLDSIYGLDKGFDVYDDNFTAPLIVSSDEPIQHVESRRGDDYESHQKYMREKVLNDSYRPDNEVSDVALALLDDLAKADGPFFLWIHYFGPHSHPDSRDNFLVTLRKHVDSYPDKVENTDREVGRVLEHLETAGIADDTMVILHADHGESLQEHGFVGHGRYLYEDNLRVPLIIRWRGRLPEGARVEGLVGNIDIMPTVLEAAGLDSKRRALDGKSLFGVVFEGLRIHRALYAETYMAALEGFADQVEDGSGKKVRVGVRRRGVLRPPWKYVVSEPFPIYGKEDEVVPEALKEKVRAKELFHIGRDPAEIWNQLPARGRIAASLAVRLARYTDGELLAEDAEKLEVSEDHIKKLRTLGYLE
jgi:arylsulfatase A-like enzyme